MFNFSYKLFCSSRAYLSSLDLFISFLLFFNNLYPFSVIFTVLSILLLWSNYFADIYIKLKCVYSLLVWPLEALSFPVSITFFLSRYMLRKRKVYFVRVPIKKFEILFIRLLTLLWFSLSVVIWNILFLPMLTLIWLWIFICQSRLDHDIQFCDWYM